MSNKNSAAGPKTYSLLPTPYSLMQKGRSGWRLDASIIRRYGSALLSTLVATLVRMALTPVLHYHSAFFAYIIAVMFTAWYGGLGPALLALGIGDLSAVYFFIEPVHSLAIHDVDSQIQCGLFAVIGLTTALLSESQKRSREQAEESVRRAQDEIAERARTEATLKKTIAEVNLLVEAGRLLGAALDPDHVYGSLRTLVARIMDCDGLLVSSFHEDEGEIRCAYAWVEGNQLDVSVFPPIRLTPESRGMQTTVLRTRRPLRVSDVEEREKQNTVTYHVESDGKVRDRPTEENRTHSLLMVPILLDDQVLGIVQVSSHRKDAYTEDQLGTLEALVLQVAAASRNAYLYRQAQTEIAERRRAEEALLRNQAQIEDLNARLQRAMTETHHRVKNNLQVVAAMIDMQMMEYGDTIPCREAERLRSHVTALAALHDLLTRQAREPGGAEAISSVMVLEKLVSLLRAAAASRTIHLRTQQATLSIRQATAIALILQELVSNCLKHGCGDIEIVFTTEGDVASLEVCDLGPGYPSDFDPHAASTGMELVSTASCWDLGGTMQFENRPEGGARALIRFPLMVSG